MLLRMISAMNKWDLSANPILREDPSFPADSVTDLKTTRNKLSVWKASDDDETNDAIVALALGRQSLDKLCFVYLDENDLKRIGIDALQDEPGSAPGIESDTILNRHMNLQQIDYTRLGKLTEYIFKQLDDENCVYKTKKELSELLLEYKEKGLVNPGIMNDRLRKKLDW